MTDFNHYDNFLPFTEKKETKLNGFAGHVDLFFVLKDHCHHQALVLIAFSNDRFLTLFEHPLIDSLHTV